MDFNIEVRKKQLENLEQFVSSSKDRVESVLHYLGWTAEKVEKETDEMVVCPLNLKHTMPLKSLGDHLKKCAIKSEGYDLKEEFLSEPAYDPQRSIMIDYNTKLDILYKARLENPYHRPAWNGHDPDPKTSNRMLSTYSSDERLAFYNFSIQNTVSPETPSEFTTFEDIKKEDDRPLTKEEILARERDAKRRRAKYRSVHINKKNYTEVIREVINGQMEEYKDWMRSKLKLPNDDKSYRKSPDTDRPHSSNSNQSNFSWKRNREWKEYKKDHREKYYKREDSRERRSRSRERRRSRDRRSPRERRRSREKTGVTDKRNNSKDGRNNSKESSVSSKERIENSKRDSPRSRRDISKERRHSPERRRNSSKDREYKEYHVKREDRDSPRHSRNSSRERNDYSRYRRERYKYSRSRH